MFYEKDVLKNFLKLTRKTTALESIFNKVSNLQLISKETSAQLFYCEFIEIVRNTYFIEHLRKAASSFIRSPAPQSV